MANAATPIQRSVQVEAPQASGAGAAAIGSAIGSVGDAVSAYGEAALKAQAQDQLVVARTSAATQYDDLVASFRADNDPATAQARFSAAASKIQNDLAGTISMPAARNQFLEDAGQLAESRRVTVGDMAFQKQVSQASANLDDSIETLSRQAAAATNPADREATLGLIQKNITGWVASGMGNAEAGQKKLQVTRERLAQFDAERALDTNPTAGLAALRNPQNFPDLDPLTREQLIGRGEADVRQAQREARMAQAQNRMAAREALSDLHDVIASGLPVSQDMLNGAREAAVASGDRNIQHRYIGLSRANDFATAMRGANPVEVSNALHALAAKANAQGADEATATAFTAASKFLTTMNGKLASDPLGWAAQQGVANPGDLKLNGQDSPQAWRQRITAANATAQRYGTAPKYLTAAEEAQIKTQFATQKDPNKKLAIVQTLVNGLGATRATDALADLTKNDPAFAQAAQLVARGNSHLPVAHEIVAGQQALAQNKDLAPSAAARAVVPVVDQMGQAFALRPADRAGVMAGANAIFAGRVTGTGKTGHDVGVINADANDQYARAVQEAAGAVFDRDGAQYGGITKYNGASVVIPSYIRADGFEDVVHALTAADLAKASASGSPPMIAGKAVPDDIIRHSWLVSAGDGLYAISTTDPSAGAITPLRDAKGRPYRLDFGKAFTLLQAKAHAADAAP